ncbi:hypothetical protein K438DRAFT_1764831 [Mycena galopus ATCC 62051]|nr:hypothetical protein K438DRAFT_1764831 [Mycena galopus ATCC 62051]
MTILETKASQFRPIRGPVAIRVWTRRCHLASCAVGGPSRRRERQRLWPQRRVAAELQRRQSLLSGRQTRPDAKHIDFDATEMLHRQSNNSPQLAARLSGSELEMFAEEIAVMLIAPPLNTLRATRRSRSVRLCKLFQGQKKTWLKQHLFNMAVIAFPWMPGWRNYARVTG